jgi:hypothetical protein
MITGTYAGGTAAAPERRIQSRRDGKAARSRAPAPHQAGRARAVVAASWAFRRPFYAYSSERAYVNEHDTNSFAAPQPTPHGCTEAIMLGTRLPARPAGRSSDPGRARRRRRDRNGPPFASWPTQPHGCRGVPFQGRGPLGCPGAALGAPYWESWMVAAVAQTGGRSSIRDFHVSARDEAPALPKRRDSQHTVHGVPSTIRRSQE